MGYFLLAGAFLAAAFLAAAFLAGAFLAGMVSFLARPAPGAPCSREAGASALLGFKSRAHQRSVTRGAAILSFRWQYAAIQVLD